MHQSFQWRQNGSLRDQRKCLRNTISLPYREWSSSLYAIQACLLKAMEVYQGVRGGPVFPIHASIGCSAPLSRHEVAAMVQLHGNVK